jgi:hypothetical protein
MDVYYDEQFRSEVALAMQSAEEFAAMLHYYGYLVDQAANMDW